MIRRQTESLFPSIGVVRLIIRNFGNSPERITKLLENTGIQSEELDNPDLIVWVSGFLALLHNIAALEGDDWFLELPLLWSDGAQGDFGLAIRSAPNFASALNLMDEFTHTRWPMTTIRKHEVAQTQRLAMRPVMRIDERIWRTITSIVALNSMTMARVTMGHLASMITLEFEGRRPRSANRMEAILDAKVTWQNSETALVVPNSLLSQASPLSDPTNLSTAIHGLRGRSALLAGVGSLTVRTHQCLSLVIEGRIDARETAGRLGLSHRTLERGLADEKTSFSQILDQSLKSRLEARLKGGRISGEALAHHLGYQDATSLYRSVRRWYGMPLSELRAKLNS